MRSPIRPTTGTSTIIRNGETRLVRQAKLRGLPSESSQFDSVYCPLTTTLTARCLRNFSTDTGSSSTVHFHHHRKPNHASICARLGYCVTYIPLQVEEILPAKPRRWALWRPEASLPQPGPRPLMALARALQVIRPVASS